MTAGVGGADTCQTGTPPSTPCEVNVGDFKFTIQQVVAATGDAQSDIQISDFVSINVGQGSLIRLESEGDIGVETLNIGTNSRLEVNASTLSARDGIRMLSGSSLEGLSPRGLHVESERWIKGVCNVTVGGGSLTMVAVDDITWPTPVPGRECVVEAAGDATFAATAG
eukprot:CAMPEP_0174934230 /NCGR_PEP_ID=MMETSP1355-20121228/48788_1 /TAXON_ID=464990 /ORGANISM="Hemiselmis tepida, Strain CCMP443" /LENGTH=167 /DNA_ID=CAMNT_0016180807 /DNA_START=208 /DNA_END=707 /DNA_ORIENTATION=-